MRNIHINIGRQIGAGGLELGKSLSSKLNIKLYDKELITLFAKESGFQRDIFDKNDEKNSLEYNNSFTLSAFVEAIQNGFGANYINGAKLFEIQSEVIRNIAKKESTIILGRCADYILRDFENSLNIFVSANMEDRIKRLRKEQKLTGIEALSDEKIAALLEKGDRKRAAYYKEYSLKKWGAAESYDLCLNSSLFSINEIVEIVENYIGKHFRTI